MWFLIALALGIGITSLVVFMRNRDIKVTWYEWLIGVIGFVLLLFTIQNAVTATIELESTASWMFLLILGLPAIVLLVVAWQLIARRQRSAG
ncbi:MAG: dehalogenase [Dehalococcoidales bacterium]